MGQKISTATFAGGDEPDAGSRKRLFVGLILGASLVLCALFFLMWYVPYIGLKTLHPMAPLAVGVFFLALGLVIGMACLGLVLNILLGRPILFSRRLRGLTIKLFLPLMTLLGRFFGISKERVRNSFIKVNNELVLSENQRYAPDKILLLMPHCLQWSKCDMRLTYDINNCKRCGKCPMKGLLGLSEYYGVHLAIATGGTIARRIVVQTRPRLIVAVACERDLASGIQDTYPLPAFGVLNERPHGPCLDTTVSLQNIEIALQRFIVSEALPAKPMDPGPAPVIADHGSARVSSDKGTGISTISSGDELDSPDDPDACGNPDSSDALDGPDSPDGRETAHVG